MLLQTDAWGRFCQLTKVFWHSIQHWNIDWNGLAAFRSIVGVEPWMFGVLE
jgi:hypothetical protein